MRAFLKKILYALPQSVRTVIVSLREWWWKMVMNNWEKIKYKNLPELKKRNGPIKNILIYHINGLTHAGTEKNLQLIANGLCEEYNIFFMYGDKTAEEGRKITINPLVTLIPFSYDMNEVAVPHKLHGMKPHIKEIIAEKSIDLIITASPGYAHYPWNTITEIPIVLSNVFGAPSLQKNIIATIFMSKTVLKHASVWTGERENYFTQFLPIGKMPPENARTLGLELRTKMGISPNDFVFGRIGRDDDTIFDPIGIRAWESIVEKYPRAHYLIMSPQPVLQKIVADEKIPRVHFLPPSGNEQDVWAFHGALDAMAHFRKDGETSGVAIAESLTIGNPIITHRSTIWNAHLEYLTSDCARIANIDSVTEYSAAMEEFMALKLNDPNSWNSLQENATNIGYYNFSPDAYIGKIHGMLRNI
jgi:hypothetical protein